MKNERGYENILSALVLSVKPPLSFVAFRGNRRHDGGDVGMLPCEIEIDRYEARLFLRNYRVGATCRVITEGVRCEAVFRTVDFDFPAPRQDKEKAAVVCPDPVRHRRVAGNVGISYENVHLFFSDHL